MKEKGGSPGLVVTGGDSWPGGRWFESQHHAWTFSHTFVVIKTKTNQKETRDGPTKS